MHSYTTLAVLALAVATASPALSAPVQEGDQQARANNLDERASAIPSGLGSDIGSLFKTIGTNAAFGALPVVLEHLLGGNSTRRADNEKRAGIASLFGDLLDSFKTDDSIGKVLGNGLLGGVASGAGAVGVGELLNHTRREPSPLVAADFSGIAKTLAGALASLGAADGVKSLFDRDDSDVSPEELIAALSLLGREINELD